MPEASSLVLLTLNSRLLFDTLMLTRFHLALALAAITCCAGCGTSGPATVPVVGKVTIGGAPPPVAGSITFAPLEYTSGSPVHPGQANFDTNGEFRATSINSRDGLVPGRYGVTIYCQKPRSNDLEDPRRYSYIPSGYRPPDIVVDTTQEEVRLDIDVPAAK